MDDALAGSSVLLAMGGLFGGAAVGGLVLVLMRFLAPGRAAGGWALVAALTVCVSACSTATARLGHWAWSMHHGSLTGTGTVVGFERETVTTRTGELATRRTNVARAIVEFTDERGQSRRFAALGGSRLAREVGAVVPVRWRPGAEADAVIDDFQHRWAALLLFGALTSVGVIAWLLAIAGLRDPPAAAGDHRRAGKAASRQAARAARTAVPRLPGPRQRRVARQFRRAGVVMVGVGIAAAFLAPFEAVERSLGLACAGVATGALCFAISALAGHRPARRKDQPPEPDAALAAEGLGARLGRAAGPLALAIIMGMFAALLWLAGAPPR